MEKITNLEFHNEHTANFRNVDANTTRLAMAQCLLNRGGIRQQKGTIRAPGTDNATYQKHLETWAAKANDDYNAAMLIFTDKTLLREEERQSKKGQGSTYIAMGKLKYYLINNHRDHYEACVVAGVIGAVAN